MKIEITEFAKKQFDRKANGTRITSSSVEDFEDYINLHTSTFEATLNDIRNHNSTSAVWNDKLKDTIKGLIDEGDDVNEKVKEHIEYIEPIIFKRKPTCLVELDSAPHCVFLTLDNITDARVGSMEITNENYQYLRSGYSARQNGELGVLSRWFELPLNPPKAKHLVLVLYSREQLEKEHNEFGETKGTPFEMEGEWGVVAILGQPTRRVNPMTPVTALRNALGVEFGGSGKPIDIDYYNRCVGFWSNNAIVKQR